MNVTKKEKFLNISIHSSIFNSTNNSIDPRRVSRPWKIL